MKTYTVCFFLFVSIINIVEHLLLCPKYECVCVLIASFVRTSLYAYIPLTILNCIQVAWHDRR